MYFSLAVKEPKVAPYAHHFEAAAWQQVRIGMVTEIGRPVQAKLHIVRWQDHVPPHYLTPEPARVPASRSP